MTQPLIPTENFAEKLGLHHQRLPVPETVQLAMETGENKVEYVLHEWVKLKLRDPSSNPLADSRYQSSAMGFEKEGNS